MERTTNQMDARLDKIIDLLLLSQATSVPGPSPFRKKTRHGSNDTGDMDVDHFDQLAQDDPEPSRDSPHTNVTPESPTRGQKPQTNSALASPSRQERREALLPPLPDSPNQNDDATWLKRQATASIAFTEKAKTLLNPYRTAQETLKANRKSILNAPSIPMGVKLTTLSSSRSDIASRGRED
jgi:hypothetical protein